MTKNNKFGALLVPRSSSLESERMHAIDDIFGYASATYQKIIQKKYEAVIGVNARTEIETVGDLKILKETDDCNKFLRLKRKLEVLGLFLTATLTEFILEVESCETPSDFHTVNNLINHRFFELSFIICHVSSNCEGPYYYGEDDMLKQLVKHLEVV